MAFYADAVSNYTARYQGEFQVGARARFFDAGTNTPRTMYSDGALTTPFDPNDIVTDANAQFPGIWGQGGAYKAVITTASGAVIRSIDNVPGDVDAGGGGGGGGSTSHAVGDIQPSILSGSRDGWVRANGKTIGNAVSSATERANADCEALFLALHPNTNFTVSGGRTTAAADWAAGKQLTLPDGQCCALVGVDAMGGTARNLFSALTFTLGSAIAVGSQVGTATHALTAAQNGVHQHTGTTASAGLHQHTGSTSTDPGHSHTAGADFQGAHAHITTVELSGANGLVSGPGAFSAGQAGFKNYPTDTQGTHNHNITVNAAGAHFHTFTTDAGGAHAHTFTTDAAGSGQAHPNTQPSLLVTYYIKL